MDSVMHVPPNWGAELHLNPGTDAAGSPLHTRETVDYVTVHEIGHGLGFHHEFVRADEVSGEGCDNSSQGDATAASVLSRYDKASVTGYGYNVFTQSRTSCRASLFGGTLSDWDKVGLADIYARCAIERGAVSYNGSSENHASPAYRPDGRWIAYESTDAVWPMGVHGDDPCQRRADFFARCSARTSAFLTSAMCIEFAPRYCIIES
jgi:hypothetical protein